MTRKAGIIGAGGVAGLGLLGMHDPDKIGTEPVDASHAGGYAAADGVELVAIADIDPEKCDTFGELWDIQSDNRFTDHNSMLDTCDLDFVSVCTPTYLHHQHVIDAAQSAANPSVIWCEKPVASSLSDAEHMIDVCDETSTELVINHPSRFTPSMQQLEATLLEEDLLGDVRAVTGQFRMELVRNSTHLIDTIISLTDLDPVSVAGHMSSDREIDESLDTAAGSDDSGGGGFLIMENGAFVTIDCTLPRNLSTMAYDFFGTKGRLSIEIPTGEWRYWKVSDSGHTEQTLDIDLAPDDYATGFANAAEHLVALADGSADNISSGREGLRSLEAIIGIYVSHQTGAKLSLPLDDPLRKVSIRSW